MSYEKTVKYSDTIEINYWKFGKTHQVKLFIHDPFNKFSPIGICLEGQTHYKKAQALGKEWAHKFATEPLPGPEEEFRKCYKVYPSLFRNRYQVLDHFFCSYGTGHQWLNGAIVNTFPQDLDDSDEALEKREKEELARIEALNLDILKEIHLKMRAEEKALPIGPLPYDEPHEFFPLCRKYSNLCNVPNHVRQDWLEVAYETALLVQNKNKIGFRELNKENPEIAKEVLKDLKSRFSDRLQIVS